MQWCHNMMMPLGAKYKTYSSREFLFISFINSGRFSIHWELKASVLFYTALHVSCSLVLLDRRDEREKLTNWHQIEQAEQTCWKKSHPAQKVSGNDTVETPFFPFWLVQKGDWERETKQCMPFQSEREVFGVRSRGGGLGKVGGHLS